MRTIPITLRPPYLKLREFLNPSRQAVILYYHRVVPRVADYDPFLLQVSCDYFDQQLEYLARAYPIITLQELVKQILAGSFAQRRQIVITFDDGYLDNYLHAYPLLRKWNLPATIFVSTAYVESQQPFFWEQLTHFVQHTSKNILDIDLPDKTIRYLLHTEEDRHRVLLELHRNTRHLCAEHLAKVLQQFEAQIPPLDQEIRPLTWEQIHEMSRTNISFGAHTHTHPVLSALSSYEAEQEIVRSKQMLEECLQQEMTVFAYPYGEQGDFNEETIALLKRHQFLCACSTYFGTNDATTNLFAMKRVVVRNWDRLSLAQKIAHVFQSQEWIA